MTLLITIFLVLINIFNTIQTNSPQVHREKKYWSNSQNEILNILILIGGGSDGDGGVGDCLYCLCLCCPYGVSCHMFSLSLSLLPLWSESSHIQYIVFVSVFVCIALKEWVTTSCFLTPTNHICRSMSALLRDKANMIFPCPHIIVYHLSLWYCPFLIFIKNIKYLKSKKQIHSKKIVLGYIHFCKNAHTS